VKSPGRRFLIAVGGISGLTVLGALGYMLIEKVSVIDAFYMAISTISTVGFGDIKSLSPAGRLFTIVFIICGVGTAFYLLTTVAEMIIEGRLRDFLGKTAMVRKIHQLQNHVIICGFGRFGRVVAEELLRNSVAVVVIDSDVSKEAELTRLEMLYVIGFALEDDVLERAAIRSARAIVVATASDADNVYITLSAHEKNPSIKIHARGESEAGLRRLQLAGAHQVISAYQRGGMRIAASILRPSVVDFLELSLPGRGDVVDLEEVEVVKESPLVGKTFGAVEQETTRVRIVALKRGGGPISIIPDSGTRIEAGDYLVVIGERGNLKRLIEKMGT
jgi:voltage-gated potassium channel